MGKSEPSCELATPFVRVLSVQCVRIWHTGSSPIIGRVPNRCEGERGMGCAGEMHNAKPLLAKLIKAPRERLHEVSY